MMPPRCPPPSPLPARSGLSLLCAAWLALAACSHAGEESSEGAAGPSTASDPGSGGDTPSPAAPPPAVPAEAVPLEPDPGPSAPVELEEITINLDELREIPGQGLLEYCLDCRRKVATYHYCEFDKAAFEAAVGPDKAGELLRLRVAKVAKSRSRDTPADPNAPQPEGGFERVRYSCSIDALLPSAG